MNNDFIAKFGFKKVLKDEACKINIELSDEMLDKFEKYKDLLIEWNEKINLTAITDEYEIILKHFVDCLEITKYIKIGDSIIDVGTGAGFPGVVIAIYFSNDIHMTLLDALNKRLIFLEEVKNLLQLSNINIVHGRAEEMAGKAEYREKFDVVVSRAVANLNILLEFDVPYIKVGGRCLIMKGDNAIQELNEAKKALEILKCKLDNNYIYTYMVNDEEYIRSILEIRKDGTTSTKYPRNFGKIKKSPLK